MFIRQRRILYVIAAYLISAFAGRMLLEVANHDYLNNLKQLAGNGVEATGAISGLDCTNHNGYRYTFTVDNKEYRSSGSSSDCPLLTIGEEVQLYYLPSNPAITSTERPKDSLLWESKVMWLAALLLPILPFVIFGGRWLADT